MKRNTLLLISASIALALYIVSSCGSSKTEIIKVDPAFREYVSGYSSGMIERKDVIEVELVAPVPKSISQKKLQKMFQLSPEIKGKVVVTDGRVLSFIPDHPLPSGQFFTATVALEEFAKVKSGYETFQFQFSTFEQDLNATIDGLKAYNDFEIRYQKFTGKLRTRDFADETALKKSFKVFLNGKPVNYSLESEIAGTDWIYTVDSVKRTAVAQEIRIEWEGSPIRANSKGSRTFSVPALGDFSVHNVNVFDDEDQYIEIRFGDPINGGQQLRGMLRLVDSLGKEVSGLTFDVDYNIVRAYLPHRLKGNYKLKVASGIENSAGGKMLKSSEFDLLLEGPKPLVRLIGSGSILPNSQGLIFPFETISLKAVDVRIIKIYEENVPHFLQVNDLDGDDELTRFGKVIAEKKVRLDYDKSKDLSQWNTHVINLDKWIKTEPGAIYQIAIKFNKSYTTCDCNDEKESDFTPSTNDGWNEYDWHEYGYEGYSTWSYRSDDSPCSDSYYYGNAVKRNILASDIGMIFKLEVDKKSTAFLTDMLTATPLVNTEVAYYDYQTQLIAKGTTNDQGMFTTQLKRKPFLMIAKRGKQRGYLKLTDGDANSMSKFDVSGEYAQEGIKGFIYTERGVWRPGDSIYVNFILQDQLKALPASHPVNFTMRDPSGNVLYEISRNTHLNGVYDFRVATKSEGKTGNYQVEVTVGNYSYTKLLKVETVKPNRLKIFLDAEQANSKDSTKIAAEWLHGAKADGLKAEVEMQLTPMRTSFELFKGYVFDSPIRNGGYQDFTIFSGNLDKKGEAVFANSVSDIKDASGMMRANYITKVYEKGGDYSIDRKMASYSPYDAYVGMKIPEGSVYDQTLETDVDQKFTFAVVDSKGKLQGKRDVQLKIYKIDRKWWYAGSQEINNYNYKDATVLFRDTVLSINGGKGSFTYRVPKHEYGRFLILATDLKSGHQTGSVVRFDWSYWSRANRADASKATMLTFSMDKEQYTKGETVRLSIPSPSDGRALVSVETSREVVKKFWIETKQGETVHEFVTTADMAPNAFVHVTMIQPHHNTKNDLPIRMYGVMPILVDDPNTHLAPIITMNDEIRPESQAKIKIQEKNGRKMTYTLAIVDDGLLDLTHFQTPQPWNTFYAKEALGIQTWDMYDDVIGAYAGSLDHLLSVGGDGEAIVGNGPKANRFPPMVKYLGPFEIPAGGSKTHTVDIPSYIGSVRVMVVARDEASYGNAQKTVKVKKPLMVLATLPRVLGPGESFALPVDVFAMEKHIKNVKVTIEVNEMFALKDSKSKTIEFTQEGDELIDFKLNTLQKLGVGKVKITAVCGNETATQEIEIDIRPSNPYEYETNQFQLEPGANLTTEVNFDGILGSQSATIEVSTVPSINLEKRLSYLVEYPHGCVEQTTSAVFPQLYLNALQELDPKTKVEIERNIKAGIARLQLFQTYEGGFGYWPGESSANDWGTNYAGHFMIEAELQGYKLPSGMKERWKTFQLNQAANWNNSDYGYSSSSHQLTQSYRLYLLALCGSPDIGAMNRLKEENGLSSISQWRLATAYAQIGQIETAKTMVSKLNHAVLPTKEISYTFGSSFRDKAIILEAETTIKLRKDAAESVKFLAQELSSDRWMSTQETAYSLMAIGRYAGVTSQNSTSAFVHSVDGSKKSSVSVGSRVKKIDVDVTSGKRKLVLTNTGSNRIFVTVTTKKIPKQGQEKSSSSNLKMNVWYEDLDGKRLDPSKIEQGTEFMAIVKLKNPSKYKYNEMALNQIFPSGWEVYNTRLFGGRTSGNKVRYQDIRDDRVLSYYDLKPYEETLIKVQLHATYKGKFYLPGIQSDAMYDHTIQAQEKGKWVEVF